MAEIKTTDSVNVIEIVQRGLKGNTGDSSLTTNPTNVTASGNISASGVITGYDLVASQNIDVGAFVKLKGHAFLSEYSGTGGFEQTIGNTNRKLALLGETISFGNAANIRHVTASGNISSSANVYAARFVSNGNQVAYNNGGINYFGTATQANHFSTHITASGNISTNITSTGSFGRVICTSISASTGQFDANTIFLGGESFSKSNITKLKAGKSIRDTSTLTAKSYELADGRKVSREYENRFNRWAPNLEFEAREGAAEKLYNEVDQIPQTYIDFTDKEYRVNMFGGRSHQKQTLYDIELNSDYDRITSTVQIKTPKTIFSSQHGEGTEVIISGSLTITGSNTLSNYGNFKNRLKDKHAFTVTTDPTATGGWREGISTPNTGSAPHLHFQLSGSGQAGIGLLNPKATLHVSASSNNFNALQVEGSTIVNGFLGANAIGNPSILTGNTVVPAGYNVLLYTSNTNPSITIPASSNYTVSTGASVRIVNMDNVGNIPQTFYNQ